MNKSLLFQLFCFLLIMGCSQPPAENSISTETILSFNLKKDLFDLSNKMINQDTVFIYANLSACTSWRYEMNTITKSENTLSIKTEIEGEFIDSNEQHLNKVEYLYQSDDSLNFENLFTYINKKGAIDEEINPTTFKIIHKTDTLLFYSKALGDHLENIDYYQKIQNRIRPEVKAYQPVIVPEPPLPDSSTSIDHLIE